MRIAAAFTASILLAPSLSVPGQESEDTASRRSRVESIRAELASGDLGRLAAALAEARRDGLREIATDVPQIVRKLAAAWPTDRKVTRRDGDAYDSAVAWALDCAIEFQVELCDDDLRGLRKGMSEDALLVAASLDPKACVETLLLLADDVGGDGVGSAACEVLASTAPERLLEKALRQLAVEIEVVVFDVEAPRPPNRKGLGVGVACGSSSGTAQVPTIPLYFVGSAPGADRVAFFHGARTLYFAREELPSISTCRSFGRTAKANRELLAWIGRLAGEDLATTPELRLVVAPPMRIQLPMPWDERLDERVESVRARIGETKRAWDGWLDRVEARGRLDGQARGRLPNPFTVKVYDQRVGSNTPLPALE